MSADGNIEIIQVDGSPWERGRALGARRASQIRACINGWLGSLSDAGIVEPQRYLDRFLADTDYTPAIAMLAPELLEEVGGIAEGSGLPVDLVLAAQLMDEEWVYRANIGAAAPSDKCSSLAARTKDGAWIIGQNMDLGRHTDGHQVVYGFGSYARLPAQLVFSIDGMIGLMGVNSSGLAICVNALPHLPASHEGLPVAFVLRKLLSHRSVEEAVGFLRSIRHASPQHYLIADQDGARSFELSCDQSIEVTALWPSAALAHTNHAIAPSWMDPPSDFKNSAARLASLEIRIAAGDHDLNWAKAALSSSDDPDHPVSRIFRAEAPPSPTTGMIGFTTGTMISVIDRASPAIECWFAKGPPSQRPFSRASLDRR